MAFQNVMLGLGMHMVTCTCLSTSSVLLRRNYLSESYNSKSDDD